MEVFDSLPILLQTFWLVAIPSSMIFLLQTIMTLFGAHAPNSFDIPHTTHDIISDDGLSGNSPLHVFSMRNLINFLLGFSWTGIAFYETIENKALLVLLSLAVGASFVYFFFAIIRQLQKLAEDNSFHLDSTLFKTAEVYLTIPERKSGQGKIMISVKGSFHELPAMTDYERIPSGALVKVIGIENENVVLVEPI